LHCHPRYLSTIAAVHVAPWKSKDAEPQKEERFLRSIIVHRLIDGHFGISWDKIMEG